MILLAAVVGAELASSSFNGITGGSSGASGPSSSYDSTASGTEALVQLLTERGHQVDRLTSPLGTAVLPGRSTVFVLDPASWKTSDTDALEHALAHGDRVVLGGPPPATGVLRLLLGIPSPPVWHPGPAGLTRPVAVRPEVTGVQSVIATGLGTYAVARDNPGEPVPLLRGPGGILALVTQGRGTLVLLASSSPLQNGSLGRDDNAAFALNLVAQGSPVVIDEYDHGFGQPGAGLAGLPA
jgi:hypothetical protein